MALAGHVSRAMMERYSHVRMEAKRKAVDTLSGTDSEPGAAQNWAQFFVSEKSEEPNSLKTDGEPERTRTSNPLINREWLVGGIAYFKPVTCEPAEDACVVNQAALAYKHTCTFGQFNVCKQNLTLKSIERSASDENFVGDKREDGPFIRVHSHPVHYFRLFKKFPEGRLQQPISSGAVISCGSQYISRCGAGGCASCTVGRTGEAASLAF